jgi:hypothetical protein
MRGSIGLLTAAIALSLAGCGSAAQSPASASAPASAAGSAASDSTASSSTVPATPAAGQTARASSVPDETVWLCKPGIASNPCGGSLDTTVVVANLATTVQRVSPAANPPVDCFYIYPTVSHQKTLNADLTIDPEERAVAVAQAAQFSQVCRVYAPMYPQLTLMAIADPSNISAQASQVAFDGVESGFRSYMAHYNGGRPIVFLGHSQGAAMLTALLKAEVDNSPDTRRLLVSAILLGGNVKVPVGKSVGGDFANIPACSSSSQTGCVIAYSSFDQPPPPNSLFGRVDTGFNTSKQTATVPLQVLCVNPAGPGGGTAPLLTYVPTDRLVTFFGKNPPGADAKTPFVSYPDEFSAHCVSSGGATWLQIDRTGGSSDLRPDIGVVEAPKWGLHSADINIAQGNLVALVRSESAAFH